MHIDIIITKIYNIFKNILYFLIIFNEKGLCFMSVLSAVTSIASSVVSGLFSSGNDYYTETGTNQYTTKRRTSVLYDYSPVQKAVFYVATNKGTALNPDLEVEDILYVQVNPSNLSVSADGARRITRPTKPTERATESPDNEKEFGLEDFTVNLKFDLYDEFSVATNDGMSTGMFGSNDKDLSSRKATSMQCFIDLVRTRDKYVYFKWGPFERFGVMVKAEFTYTAFSCFGHPLKAEGSVTIRETWWTIDSSGVVNRYPDVQDGSGSLFSKASSNDTIDSAGTTAELALRELLS